jgi:hypothetical protein
MILCHILSAHERLITWTEAARLIWRDIEPIARDLFALASISLFVAAFVLVAAGIS